MPTETVARWRTVRSEASIEQHRLSSLAKQRARNRLSELHRAEYERLVNEERHKLGLPPTAHLVIPNHG